MVDQGMENCLDTNDDSIIPFESIISRIPERLEMTGNAEIGVGLGGVLQYSYFANREARS